MSKSLTIRPKYEQLQNILIVAYIFSTIVLDSYAKYVPIRNVITMLLIGVFGIQALRKRTFRVDHFLAITIAFVIFCFASSLWAVGPMSSISRGLTMLQIFAIDYLIYEYLITTRQESKFLSMISIAGTAACLFVIIYYGGFNYFRLINSYHRLGQEIANTNDLGIFAAVTCAICFYEVYTEKKKIYIIFFLICITIVGGSGSRSALIMAVLSILLYVLSLLEPKKALKILLSIVVITVAIYFASTKISLFNYTINRLINVRNFFSGEGHTDNSVIIRQSLIHEGIEQFFKTPILGIGVANAPYFLTAKYYCHNNYVELLSTAGLVGTIIFYLRYLVPLHGLAKYYKKNLFANFTIAIIISFMLIEYFHVSYYEKFSSFIPMLGFLCLSMMQRQPSLNNGEKI